MRTLFLPVLVNGLCGDPAVWIDLLDEGRSVLFDAGDLSALPSRKLLRVDHVVVSHTHMDHFLGFDHLLRLALRRERELVVTGPAGFIERVASRLASYTWNLIASYPLRLKVQEVTDEGTVRSATFAAVDGLVQRPGTDRAVQGTVHAERLFTLQAAVFDHGIPVLGAALREGEHLSVDRDRLERRGLVPGPWLRELKDLARRREPDDVPVAAMTMDGSTRRIPKGDLEADLIRRGPGQVVAYLTDLAFTPENVSRAADLARDADLLVCEAAFLHEDEARARERRHLTARQAGEIARAAGARRLAPFHLSPRYQGREAEVLAEAADAFGGPVLTLPTQARPGAHERGEG